MSARLVIGLGTGRCGTNTLAALLDLQDGASVSHERNDADLHWEGADGTKHATKLFAKLGVLLADEPALKEILDCKGHGGSKPCCCCLNATHHKPPGGAGGEASPRSSKASSP